LSRRSVNRSSGSASTILCRLSRTIMFRNAALLFSPRLPAQSFMHKHFK
jgi:hypothetical protein